MITRAPRPLVKAVLATLLLWAGQKSVWIFAAAIVAALLVGFFTCVLMWDLFANKPLAGG